MAGQSTLPPHSGGPKAKVLSLPELLLRREQARREGRALVQCHGCFDIVHPGHIRHLRQAKSHGDILLVSITGDGAYTKRAGAPLIPQELRAENLAELDCVDWVYIEPTPTAQPLLERVRPDVYVKGREYEHNDDPRFQAERRTVESGGGRVVFSSGDVVFSSTALIGAMEASIDPYHARLAQLLADESLEGPSLTGLVARFRGKRVLVVGETIIDTYIHCDQPEVAAESPVMTLRPLQRKSYDGGAAVIARHLAAMGARPTLLTGLPDSPGAEALRQRLLADGIDLLSLPIDAAIPEKQRFLVGAQKVMKLNMLESIVPDAALHDRLVHLACEAADGADACIIADFGNGLLTGATVQRLCAGVRDRVGVLAGDVSGRRSSLMHFAEADLLCPSEREAREAVRNFDESIPTVAHELLERTRARAALVTMGPDGLIAFDRLPNASPALTTDSGQFPKRLTSEHVPALGGHAIDPLGCGDALLSAATLALAAGGDLLQAAFLGSIAAAAQAQRLGNNAISSTDLRHGIVRVHTARLAYAPAAAELSVTRDRPLAGRA
jgi:rfaE bifunctional protein kinase chain/domain/rfaE bifunctional protein nucleotidyltransferase chain/domain